MDFLGTTERNTVSSAIGVIERVLQVYSVSLIVGLLVSVSGAYFVVVGRDVFGSILLAYTGVTVLCVLSVGSSRVYVTIDTVHARSVRNVDISEYSRMERWFLLGSSGMWICGVVLSVASVALTFTIGVTGEPQTSELIGVGLVSFVLFIIGMFFTRELKRYLRSIET